MQQLDDDMDELFRRAAEEYPLNTKGGDWNKVLQQLHPDKEDLPKQEKSKSDYKYLWLLLLLPIGFVCGRYLGNGKVATETTAKKPEIVPPQNSIESVVSRPAAMEKSISDKAKKEKTATGKSNPGSLGFKKVNTAVGKPVGTDKAANVNRIRKAANSNVSKAIAVTVKKKSLSTNTTKHRQTPIHALPGVVAHSATKDDAGLEKVVDKNAGDNPSFAPEKGAFNSGNTPVTTAPVDSVTISTSVANNATKIVAKESKGLRQKDFEPSLSYSLVLGPDVSTVKLQKASNVGYSLGVMFQYHFVKKLTLEAGALWERKNYYTDGKYMDTSSLKLPMHSIVNTATGYCNMVEIPFNVKYDFISKGKSSWFLSTGVSSYLMKNEDYDILYERYGQSYSKDYGYKNSTKDWFSIINFSMGYQKSIGKHTAISIAPYVKLPLRGIGIGKLPVSSTGIYFSVSGLIK